MVRCQCAPPVRSTNLSVANTSTVGWSSFLCTSGALAKPLRAFAPTNCLWHADRQFIAGQIASLYPITIGMQFGHIRPTDSCYICDSHVALAKPFRPDELLMARSYDRQFVADQVATIFLL